MKKTTLTEDIKRMFEIMNNEDGMLILESNLLLEGPTIGAAVKSAEKFLDKTATVFDSNARDAAEKFLDKDPVFTGKGRGRKSFEVRLNNFIDKYNNEQGFNKLSQYIKDVSSVSEPFAKHFAEQYKDKFAKWEGVVKNDPKYQSNPDEKFNDLITKTFGKDVLKAYREIPPTSSVGSRAGSPTPPTPPLPESLKGKIESSMSKENWDKIIKKEPNLTKAEKIFLTDSLWFRKTRAQIKYMLDGAFKEEDEIIERITELINSANKDITNGEMVTTKYKAIDLLISRLGKNKNFRKQSVYDIIQKNMTEDGKVDFSDATTIMEKLKKTQPLEKGYPTWIKDFIDESYLFRALKGIRSKEISTSEKISNFLERTKMLLISGSARKMDDIFDEFYKNRKFWGGTWRYYAWMQFVSKVCIPTFYGFLHAVYYGATVESNINPKDFMKAWADGIAKEWEQIFYVQQNNFAKKLGLKENQINWLEAINPFHQYALDVIRLGNWWSRGGFIRWNQKTAKDFENVYKPKIDSLSKSVNVLKDKGKASMDSMINVTNKRIEDLENRFKNLDKTQVVTNIGNSEPGFKLWCSRNNYKFKSFSNSVGTTDDGQDWVWNKDLNTFEKY